MSTGEHADEAKAFGGLATLREVPADAFPEDDSLLVEGVDIVGLSAFFETARPVAPLGLTSIDHWLGGETPLWVESGNSRVLFEACRRHPLGVAEELGFSALDLEDVVTVSGQFGRVLELVRGDLGVADGLPEEQPGVFRLGEGTEGERDWSCATTLRPSGLPMFLAERSGRVALGEQLGLVRSWRAGSDGSTLGDDPSIREVAARVDRDRPLWFKLRFHRHPAIVLPFLRFGVNVWSFEGALRMTLVYGTSDREAAGVRIDERVTALSSDSDEFGTPYADWFRVVDAEVLGSLIVVTLEPVDAAAVNATLLALSIGCSLLPSS